MTGLDKSFDDVAKFHKAFGHPHNKVPTIQPLDRADKRGTWINEEVTELKEARTLVDQADAYLDIIYFAVGGLVELGIKPEALWNFVQAANMAKLQPDGSVKRNETGKILKPEGWEAPEPKILAEIERQTKLASNNN